MFSGGNLNFFRIFSKERKKFLGNIKNLLRETVSHILEDSRGRRDIFD